MNALRCIVVNTDSMQKNFYEMGLHFTEVQVKVQCTGEEKLSKCPYHEKYFCKKLDSIQ